MLVVVCARVREQGEEQTPTETETVQVDPLSLTHTRHAYSRFRLV
jgi:hypothetical protein